MDLITSAMNGLAHGPRHVYRTLKRTLFGKSLRGKVVVLTGASSGIGKALAHCLFDNGCKLILASRNTQALENLKNDLMTSFKKAVYEEPVVVHLDMSGNDREILQTSEEILSIFNHVDILINCAGVSHRGTVQDTDLQVHRDIMQVNYFGPIALVMALLPSLISRQGHIVTVSSLQGVLAMPSRSAYSASKHAIQAFTDSLRIELNARGHKVAVTTVSPGYVKTNLSLNALTGSGNKHGTMDVNQSGGYEADYVAHEIVNGIALEDEDLVIAKLSHSAIAALRHITPSIVFRILEVREAVSLGTLVQYSKTWLPRMAAPSYWKAKKDYFLSKNE